eukprot:7001777-Prymnesium_polylepis.1
MTRRGVLLVVAAVAVAVAARDEAAEVAPEEEELAFGAEGACAHRPPSAFGTPYRRPPPRSPDAARAELRAPHAGRDGCDVRRLARQVLQGQRAALHARRVYVAAPRYAAHRVARVQGTAADQRGDGGHERLAVAGQAVWDHVGAGRAALQGRRHVLFPGRRLLHGEVRAQRG